MGSEATPAFHQTYQPTVPIFRFLPTYTNIDRATVSSLACYVFLSKPFGRPYEVVRPMDMAEVNRMPRRHILHIHSKDSEDPRWDDSSTLRQPDISRTLDNLSSMPTTRSA